MSEEKKYIPLIDTLNYKQVCKLFKIHFITTRLEALYFFNECYGIVKPFMFDFVTTAYENGLLDE